MKDGYIFLPAGVAHFSLAFNTRCPSRQFFMFEGLGWAPLGSGVASETFLTMGTFMWLPLTNLSNLFSRFHVLKPQGHFGLS